MANKEEKGMRPNVFPYLRDLKPHEGVYGDSETDFNGNPHSDIIQLKIKQLSSNQKHKKRTRLLVKRKKV